MIHIKIFFSVVAALRIFCQNIIVGPRPPVCCKRTSRKPAEVFNISDMMTNKLTVVLPYFIVVLLGFSQIFVSKYSIEASVDWISRPRSRLFVNAGETAEINWKFSPGAKLITYKKKTVEGDEIMIASKQGAAEPEMFNATESIIRIGKSGALIILNAGLKDEGVYEIVVAYNKGITLKDGVEIKIQGNLN